MQIDGLMASMLGSNLNGGGGGGGSGGGSPEAAEAALSSLSSGAAASSGGIPAALHNLQRLLQSQLAGMNPLQLQQVLQRQQVRNSYTDVQINVVKGCVSAVILSRNLWPRLFGRQSRWGSKIDCCLRSKQRD